jgi:hypothetical protein
MHDLLLWLVGSVALYAAGSNVSWSWERQAAEPGGPFLRRPWTDLLRAAYFVGIPALALALRVPSSAQMGLPQVSGSSWTDGGPMAWPRDLLAVLGLALLGGGLVLFGRVWRARAVGEALAPRWRRLPLSTLVGVTERALLQESHCAFYRACLIASGLASRDLAVFLSLLVLGLEAWSSPKLRLAAEPVRAAEGFSQRFILATLSAGLFLATGSSLWAFLGQLCALVLVAASGLDLDETAPIPGRPPSAAKRVGAAPPDPVPVTPPPPLPARPEPEGIEPTVV